MARHRERQDMRSSRIRSLFALLAAGVVAAGVLAVEPADAAKRTAKTAKADKKAKAAKSESGHRTYAQYEKDATAYWQSVVDMRRVRIAKRNRGEAIELTDYVLTQPPHWPGALPRRPLPPGRPGPPCCRRGGVACRPPPDRPGPPGPFGGAPGRGCRRRRRSPGERRPGSPPRAWRGTRRRAGAVACG